MELAYYPGCTLHASSELYDVQSKRIFKELGVELKELDDWNCCGATSAGKTDDFLAVAMPARNLGIAEASGLAEMVIPCSACYSRTLVAQNRLLNDQGMLSEINEELDKKVQGKIKVSSHWTRHSPPSRLRFMTVSRMMSPTRMLLSVMR